MKLSIYNIITVFLCLTGMPLVLFAQNKPNATSIPSAIARPQPAAYPEGTGWNFIRTWQPARPLTVPATVKTYTESKDVRQVTQYFDGLGRILQTVNKGVSPKTAEDNVGKKDMVKPIIYDDFGRETVKYLPYTSSSGTDGEFKLNAFAEQATFSVAQYPGETVFYNETNFEASPLSRIQKIMSPGNSWAGNGRGAAQDYKLNLLTDEVKRWFVGTGGYPETANDYTDGLLFKDISKDESDHQVVEFKDKNGRVILKKVQIANVPGAGHTGWSCTYYVYDAIGDLRFVLPPKAVEVLAGNNWDVSNLTFRKELCYSYLYDSRKRVIMKQEPGIEPVEMIYDARDRLVFNQDGNLRALNKWLVTFYDDMNRPTMTALYSTTEDANTLRTAMTGAVSQNITHNIPVPSSLTVNVHDGRLIYKAAQEIVFTEGFDTGTSETETELNPSASQSTEIIYATNVLPGLNQANLEPLTYTYYNDYTFSGKRDPETHSLTTIGSPFADEQPISYETKGMQTGKKVKVLDGSDLWLTTSVYYDTKGRVRQTLTDNIANGVDVATNLYNFTGQVLSAGLIQRNPRSQLTPQTTVVTMLEYDHAGRAIKVSKKLNDKTPVDIATMEYNGLGQLKEKVFKRTDNTALESLVYDYNIRGWIRGINMDYANGGSGHYFGQELNYDHGFDVPQYNGSITGMKWRGFNDGERRAYGFSYDRANRLMKGDFNQYTGGAWNKNANVNYDVLMGNGADPLTAYDGNSNIKRMQQWGLTAPASSSLIDDLRYGYLNSGNSNKLQAVTDEGTNPNPALGDFKEVTKGQTTDYTYDVNGNAISDNNKQISQIIYNYLNLPQQITLTGKGTIGYVYDAIGIKHRKIVTDQTVGPAKVITTDYIGEMVYENDRLELISHEEGRVRIEYPNGQPIQYTFDYFVKDHLGNVRMVLTEGTQQQLYLASMETERAAAENTLFSNIEASRSSRPAGYPEDKTTAKNSYVAQLNGNDPNKRIGPSLILKVMAGDTISIGARAFYKSIGGKQNKTLIPAQDMAKALVNAFGGIQGGPGEKRVSSQPGERSPFNEQFVNNQYQRMKEKDPSAGTQVARPKAYLNFVLFDEQFNLVEDNSGVKQVQAQPDQLQTLAQDKMVMQKGGFLYVYTSNETPQNVFFDNLTVTTNPGALLEETHYYPFGLTMKGISYKAVGKRENKYLYNSKELQAGEFSDGSGLEWYDHGARMFDPQIGRWHVVDPVASMYQNKSPYNFSSNDPINRLDPFGLTDYRINGEIKTINDGHTGVTIDVSEWEFNNLQRRFNRGWGYERYMNKLSVKNGFTTSTPYRQEMGPSTVTGFDVVVHKPGGENYSEWAISERTPTYAKVEHTVRIADAALGAMTGQFENVAIGSNNKLYFRKPSGRIFYGNQSVTVSLASVKYARFSKLTGRAGIAGGVLTGSYEIYQGYIQDGNTVGYNTGVQTAGAIGSVASGYVGAEAGAAIGAMVGAWFGGVGAVPGAIIGGFIGAAGLGWAGDIYGEQLYKNVVK